ncbi:MAG: hypothetical protein M3040_17825 [Bacteroidota bacterium]|nr:hypothetical protein [Bacteroidota bacterium]
MKNRPVIIYTACKLAEDKDEVKKLGAVGFITKPSIMAPVKNELKIISQELREKLK